MEHFFELPVIFNSEEYSFRGRLVTFGYSYKFYIIINGQEVVFERDDEMNYRVLGTDDPVKRSIDTALLEAVICSLSKITEDKK